MTSKKEGTNMGKKKKGYGKIAVLMLVLTLILAFSGFAIAEQEWLPGYGDKNGRLGKDGQAWRIGYINTDVFEGPTSNDFETRLSATDPTAINRLLLPDNSGTLLSSGGVTGVIPLSNNTVFIGNASGLGEEQSVALINDVTGSLIFNGVINTTISASTITSAMIIDNSVASADILNGTIASIDILNATILGVDIGSGAVSTTNILNGTVAAIDIAANAVGASELYRIVNTLVIAGGTASNSVGNNALYNAAGYTLTPRNNNATGAWIANSTSDVNGNVTVFMNDTLALLNDYTVEIVRWAP